MHLLAIPAVRKNSGLSGGVGVIARAHVDMWLPPTFCLHPGRLMVLHLRLPVLGHFALYVCYMHTGTPDHVSAANRD
eukprot:11813182-Prorocentrum_lima.AAC.1